MIELSTHDGARYYTDDDGAVLARTNGPTGWQYSGRWTITGLARRHNSGWEVPLADAADGADIGHGYVNDLDHGYRRRWLGNGSRAIRVRRLSADEALEVRARLRIPDPITTPSR